MMMSQSTGQIVNLIFAEMYCSDFKFKTSIGPIYFKLSPFCFSYFPAFKQMNSLIISDRFHTVCFTMQPTNQNSALSLK